MSYISGHYRKGHYRNGKWVNSGYVKSHYRSGLSYGSGLYSLNTTKIDPIEKHTPSNDIEWQKMITPKNLKIISEMKKDIGHYSYARTLIFFEAYYPYDIEDVHYEDVMLSMNLSTSIDELLAIRIKLESKVKSEIKQDFLEKIPYNVNNDLYERLSKDDVWNTSDFKKMKDYLKNDIKTCYNENIVRLLRNQETITEEFCGECFINLSNSSNIVEYKNQIIQLAKEKSGLDVSTLLETIAKRYDDFKTHWNSYKGFKEGMNGYNQAKKIVEDDYEYLKHYNWRLLPWQKAFYSKIDRLNNDNRKYWREIKEQDGSAPKLEVNNTDNVNVITIVATIVIVGIIVGLLIYINSSVGGSGDGTLENWIIAIIVILALLKIR